VGWRWENCKQENHCYFLGDSEPWEVGIAGEELPAATYTAFGKEDLSRRMTVVTTWKAEKRSPSH
jgi:hypothetical protein